MQVRWTAAVEVSDWRNVGQSTAGKPVHLGDQPDRIVDMFDQIPSKRLVVLGKWGAGKTVHALLFTLGWLERRQPGDPVPVIFSLGSWIPEQQRLDEWLSERLADDYPFLGSTLAQELVDAGRVLPVLDGLDEILESPRGEAIRCLNAAFDHDDPVVLTCRTDKYRDTVAAADVFTAAAVIELQPASLDDLADYLSRTTPPSSQREVGTGPGLSAGEPGPACRANCGRGVVHPVDGLAGPRRLRRPQRQPHRSP
jgi:predicted NACHT family NTPase